MNSCYINIRQCFHFVIHTLRKCFVEKLHLWEKIFWNTGVLGNLCTERHFPLNLSIDIYGGERLTPHTKKAASSSGGHTKGLSVWSVRVSRYNSVLLQSKNMHVYFAPTSESEGCVCPVVNWVYFLPLPCVYWRWAPAEPASGRLYFFSGGTKRVRWWKIILDYGRKLQYLQKTCKYT